MLGVDGRGYGRGSLFGKFEDVVKFATWNFP